MSFAVAIIATNQVRRAVTNSVNDSFRVVSRIYKSSLCRALTISVSRIAPDCRIDDCRYHAGFSDFGDKLLIDAVTVFLAFYAEISGAPAERQRIGLRDIGNANAEHRCGCGLLAAGLRGGFNRAVLLDKPGAKLNRIITLTVHRLFSRGVWLRLSIGKTPSFGSRNGEREPTRIPLSCSQSRRGIKTGNHRLNLTAEKYAVFVIRRISIMTKVNFNEGG